MDFEAKDFYEAARERMAQAELLFSLAAEHCQGLQDRRYALVVYAGGLAVECMLRAYRSKVNSQIESRHNLARLFVESGLDNRLEEHLTRLGHDPASEAAVEQLTILRAHVEAVIELWQNNHRFASEAMLSRDYLARKVIRREDNRGRKSQVLRKKARLLLEHAERIIQVGVDVWT